MQSEKAQILSKNLQNEHIKQGVELILSQFQPNQPLTKTFARNYPKNTLTYNQRQKLWAHWISVSIQKGLIVGLFLGEQLIGISICKDINYELPQIEEEYSTIFTQEKCFIQLQQQFLKGISQQLQQILKKQGVALEIMIIVIHKSCQGKGLSHRLIAQSCKLAQSKKYKYCYCQASNFKTAKCLSRNNFQKLFQIDLCPFDVEGIKPFWNISLQDRIASSWIKKIQI